MNGRTIYQLHALGAAGVGWVNPDVDAAEPCGHGLDRLGAWLDDVAGLGAGAVLLTPIFVSQTHGYDTVDPFRIDQRLGDDAAFDRFVGACHDRDLLLFLDGVFNHVGRAFPAFRDVLERGRESEYTGWFELDFEHDDGDGFAYKTFEGHRELVALNHGDERVLDWAQRVACHWLDRGADGWRLDAAYTIRRSFLAALADAIHARFADAFVFGEVIHGDYTGFVDATRVDSVTQYELHKAIWSSLNDANLFELAWALRRHREMVAAFAPVTFVGNHDVTRIASQVTDPARLPAAFATLFALPGHPCIYYGDELGWTGVKQQGPGGDDAIRPPLPDHADGDHGLLALHRELVAFRRANRWLTTADCEVVEVANHRLVVSMATGEQRVALVVDLDHADVGAPGPTLISGAHFAIGG